MRLPSPLSALLLFGLGLASCSGGERASIDHEARRAELRESLRARLGPAYDQPVAALAAADLEQGRSVYERSCAACHGDKGDGKGHRAGILDPPPASLVAGRARDFYSDAGQLQLVREGVPMTGMPPFGRSLKEEDLVAAYAWVVALREGGAPATPAVP